MRINVISELHKQDVSFMHKILKVFFIRYNIQNIFKDNSLIIILSPSEYAVASCPYTTCSASPTMSLNYACKIYSLMSPSLENLRPSGQVL